MNIAIICWQAESILRQMFRYFCTIHRARKLKAAVLIACTDTVAHISAHWSHALSLLQLQARATAVEIQYPTHFINTNRTVFHFIYSIGLCRAFVCAFLCCQCWCSCRFLPQLVVSYAPRSISFATYTHTHMRARATWSQLNGIKIGWIRIWQWKHRVSKFRITNDPIFRFCSHSLL